MYTKLRALARSILNRLLRIIHGDQNAWLKRCERILHIGANQGQEIPLYASFNLEVVWIEAIPAVFKRLQANLTGIPKQTALEALVTAEEGRECTFNIASNEGQSSSIYALKDHVHLWPDIHYVDRVTLHSRRLENLLLEKGYAANHFDAAILDVQGAELLVLQGAGAYMKNLQYVQCEAADFEGYEGACNLATLTAFMATQGFRIHKKHVLLSHKNIGTYYDVLFLRTT
ncbi:FkbM family methyltransferase [soil metagenome]